MPDEFDPDAFKFPPSGGPAKKKPKIHTAGPPEPALPTEEEFRAGGGKGNVRFKVEQLAAKAAQGCKLWEELQELQKKFTAHNDSFDETVCKALDDGILKLNRAYITTAGILTVSLLPGRGGLPSVQLLPLAPGFLHAEVKHEGDPSD